MAKIRARTTDRETAGEIPDNYCASGRTPVVHKGSIGNFNKGELNMKKQMMRANWMKKLLLIAITAFSLMVVCGGCRYYEGHGDGGHHGGGEHH